MTFGYNEADTRAKPPPPPEPTISIKGFDVHVTHAGSFIVTDVDGKAMPVPIAEYKARLAARLVQEAHTLGEFRRLWVDPPSRKELIDTLVTAGYSPSVVRMVDDKQDYDLYDVLAELGWGMSPRTRHDRTLAQKELAKKLHTSQQQISRLESPSCEGHSLSMLRRVARALNAEIKVSIEPAPGPDMVAESRAKYGKKHIYYTTSVRFNFQEQRL